MENQSLTITTEPQAVTGNWKIAYAELESRYLQPSPAPISEIVSMASLGKVASLATITMNWPSFVHWTVTGGTKTGIDKLSDYITSTGYKQLNNVEDLFTRLFFEHNHTFTFLHPHCY